MKKALLSLGFLAVVAATSVSLNSCDKIADNIDPFGFSHEETVTVPLVPAGTSASDGDTADVNLDQLIKDNAGGNFGVNNIQSVTIDRITLTILNHDSVNHITNFDNATVSVNSDKGIELGKPNVVLSKTIADGGYDPNNQSIVIDGDANNNLADYLKGMKVYYTFSATSRRATTKELDVKVKVDYKAKVKP